MRLGQRAVERSDNAGAKTTPLVVGLEVEPVHACVARWMLDLAELRGLMHTIHLYHTHLLSPEPEDEKMEAMDSNKDGHLSFDEIRAALQPHADLDDATKAELNKQIIMLNDTFLHADENNDGLLDLAELRTLTHLGYIYNTHLLSTEPEEEKMAAMDANKDGKLSLAEIKAALRPSKDMGNSTIAALERQTGIVNGTFPHADQDKDGLLDLVELRVFMHTIHIYNTHLLSPEPEEEKMDAMDTNADRKLSLDEITVALQPSKDMDNDTMLELQKQTEIVNGTFPHVDEDNDGLLDLAELRALMHTIHAYNTNLLFPESEEEKMEAMDADGDGKLSLDELMTALQPSEDMDDETKEELQKQAAMVNDLFPHTDGDNDGRLGLGELRVLMHAVHVYMTHLFSPEPEEEKMGAMDANKDGKLSLDEIMTELQPLDFFDDESKAELYKQAVMVTEVFPHADEDKDGMLDLAELHGLMHTVHIYNAHLLSPEPENEKMEAMDANKDGKLSLEEIMAALQPLESMDELTKAELNNQATMVTEIFPQADEDNDGMLDLAELRGLMHTVHTYNTHLLSPEPDAEKMEAMDTNKDGKLSLDEIMDALHPSEGMDDETTAELQKQAQMVQDIFPQSDVDNDGSLDLAELGVLMHAIHIYNTHLLSTEPEEEKMKAMDTNNDGKLSLDEIKAALQPSSDMDDETKAELQKQADTVNGIFPQSDADNDGLLDLAELRALMQHLQHREEL
jgi:Ca2+-binding EF-hand superfamily protein